jgi:hypothetical protein
VRVEHAPTTVPGPDGLHGACTCGWVAGRGYRGTAARMWAMSDAGTHLEDRAALAAAQTAHRTRTAHQGVSA